MVNTSLLFLSLPLLIGALPLNSTAPSNSKSSLTVVYQDNLNNTDDANHVGFLLLDAVRQSEAQASCASVGESLISSETIKAHQADFLRPLAYMSEVEDFDDEQSFWIQNGSLAVVDSQLSFQKLRSRDSASYPVICTQSSDSTQTSITTKSKKVSVSSKSNVFTGFVNKKAFSFQGVRYASQPKRFDYASVYAPKSQSLDATKYGATCTDSEDCLFLNIQTPYLPKVGDEGRLRPVLFWIHGGGFTGGAGSAGYDGSDLAAKEDVVVVTINYRLSTIGFLTVPNTTVTGNYGIADQVTALEWTIANIASFGGDPDQITIAGESAGAGSVRTLLGSPKAIGKFQGAIAMSNLGGGVDLGLSGDYGSTYSAYLTAAESYSRAGQQIFTGLGCNQTSVTEQIACLKTVDFKKIMGLSTVARYVTQDGRYVNTPNLRVTGRSGNTAYVPVIFGVTADDGASFSTLPKTAVATEVEGIQAALGISQSYAQQIIDSGLFPLYNTGNITLDSFNVSARVATDKTFRCVDQATVYAGSKTGTFPRAYYYQMDRTIDGYDPNNLGPPKDDNPVNPYFRLHGADIPWLFGSIARIRDANDVYSLQLSTSYFGAFIKTGRPDPDLDLTSIKGYDKVVDAIKKTGQWQPVAGDKGPIRKIDYPPAASAFVDVPQCAFLNYTLSYYLDGGR